jgi:AcrR family transcriptional regulator
MGITAPSLYAAFGDKRRLFLEAADRYQAGVGKTTTMRPNVIHRRDA